MHVYWHQIDFIIDRVYHFYKGDKNDIAKINFQWCRICLNNYLPVVINYNKAFFISPKISIGIHNYIKVLHCKKSDISSIELFKAMILCRSLEVIDFSGTRGADLLIARCLIDFNLNSVNFEWCNIGDDSVKEIVKCKSITYLNLSNCFDITNIGLSFITQLSKLKSIELGGLLLINDEGIKHFYMLQELESINLSKNESIGDDSILHLSKCVNVTCLNLSFCCKLSNIATMHLLEFKNLKELFLDWCFKIDDIAAFNLSKSQTISKLSLDGCEKITHEGRKALSLNQRISLSSKGSFAF